MVQDNAHDIISSEYFPRVLKCPSCLSQSSTRLGLLYFLNKGKKVILSSKSYVILARLVACQWDVPTAHDCEGALLDTSGRYRLFYCL